MKLADTNILINISKQANKGFLLSDIAISRISYIEFLSNPTFLDSDVIEAMIFLSAFETIELNEDISFLSAKIRRIKKQLKLPDAIIMATAFSKNLDLVTDDELMQEIYAGLKDFLNKPSN